MALLDPLVIAVIATIVLALGVVGSAVPAVPGALLSFGGVLGYWWSTGFTDPSVPIAVGLLVLAGIALLVDYFGGAIAASVGGASPLTVGVATIVGVVLAFVVGPIGILVGLAGTVFVVEYWQSRDRAASGRAAVYATVGVLASTVAQVALTATVFLAFVVVVFVL